MIDGKAYTVDWWHLFRRVRPTECEKLDAWIEATIGTTLADAKITHIWLNEGYVMVSQDTGARDNAGDYIYAVNRYMSDTPPPCWPPLDRGWLADLPNDTNQPTGAEP